MKGASRPSVYPSTPFHLLLLVLLSMPLCLFSGAQPHQSRTPPPKLWLISLFSLNSSHLQEYSYQMGRALLWDGAEAALGALHRAHASCRPPYVLEQLW